MTVADIAKLANVSKSAVSLALNNKPGISEDKRKLILTIAEQYGYITKHVTCKKETMSFIRFLVIKSSSFSQEQDISNTFFAEIIHGIESECKNFNYSLLISTLDEDNISEGLLELQQTSNCIGTIILGTNLENNQINTITDCLPNCIVIDNPSQIIDVSSVSINNVQGAYAAASHIIHLGHKKLGYVASKNTLENFRLRYQGFKLSTVSHNIEYFEEYKVGSSIKEAYDDFNQIIESNRKFLPDALFCESDYIALGVIKALQHNNIKVPEDISIIGFDNVPEGRVFTPELTTIAINKGELGRQAIFELHRMINYSDHTSLKITLNTNLIKRNSCKSI